MKRFFSRLCEMAFLAALYMSVAFYVHERNETHQPAAAAAVSTPSATTPVADAPPLPVHADEPKSEPAKDVPATAAVVEEARTYPMPRIAILGQPQTVKVAQFAAARTLATHAPSQITKYLEESGPSFPPQPLSQAIAEPIDASVDAPIDAIPEDILAVMKPKPEADKVEVKPETKRLPPAQPQQQVQYCTCRKCRRYYGW